jgi:hypothetical protein
VFNLRELPVQDQRRELFVRQLEDVPRRLLECSFLLLTDVGLLVLGKAIDEEGTMPLAVQNQGPVASRATLPKASHTLFDDSAAEIGID